MKKRDYVFLLALLVLMVIISAGTYTYARYLTTVETSSDVTIAKWQVAVKEGSNELSSTQKLTLTVNENTNVADGKMAIKSLSVGGVDLTKNGEGKYVGAISLDDALANKLTTVKVTVEWTNDETNNENDTTTGKTAGTINLPINITVKQHID